MQIQVKQNDLTYGSFTLTPTGVVTVGMPAFEEWKRCGEFIQKASRSVHFWIGDWLNFGEDAYGEDFAEIMDERKYKYTTLQNDRWVSKRIPASRRRGDLSFSHHQEIADLEEEEQNAMLDIAEKNKLPLAEFRKVVRRYKLKLDVPELTDEQLKPLDPATLQTVQTIIDASVHTLELLDELKWNTLNVESVDWLVSHLKRAGTHYFGLVKKYDKQKPLSDAVVQKA